MDVLLLYLMYLCCTAGNFQLALSKKTTKYLKTKMRCKYNKNIKFSCCAYSSFCVPSIFIFNFLIPQIPWI